MNVLQQTARMGRLDTALGKDALNLVRFEGAEAVNDLFTYQVEAVSDRDDLDFDTLLGTHATVHLRSFDASEVPFDGIVTDISMAGATPSGWRYQLVLRPWIWLMSLRRKQQIYHEMNVVEIVEEVIAPYGKQIDQRLSGSYPTLEYTVQYRESDLDFVTRMLERFGISYHFSHQAGAHTLVLTDAVDQHDDAGARPFYGVDGGHRATEEHFWRVVPARRITTGAIRLTDYNFKTPTAAMEVDKTGDAAHAEGQWESYDFPGLYLDQGAGKGVAGLRKDQERGQAPRVQADGDCASLRAGHRVKVTGEKVHGVSQCLCLNAHHRYTAGDYATGGAEEEEAYTGAWAFMPQSAPLAPELKTPRAVVQGPHTGTVVGDGEIDCDEYGRILVHFHWDLDKRISMRCRVSQNWAGKGWGGMVIPRIGMEVVVEFLEGDPDKPLVTGCVYNGKNETPYPLPEHKTKSVFRSDSHKSKGFNEFTFEDATGAENISLHAQKDQTLKVLNNRSKRVDNNQTESIGVNKSIDVGKNHQEKIGGSMNLSIGAGSGIALFAGLAGLMGISSKAGKNGAGESGDAFVGQFLGGMEKVSVAAEAASLPTNATFTSAGQFRDIAGRAQLNAGAAVGALVGQVMPISGIKTTIVEKAQSDTIGLARTEQIGLFKNTFVGKVQNTVVGTKQMTEVGETKTIDVGKHMEINVGEDFIVTVGKSRLIMTKEGNIVLQGVKIDIEGEKQIRAQAKLIDLN